MKANRAYKLRIYPNFDKLDTARYTYKRHLEYVNMWTGRLFFNGNKSLSIKSMGQLAHQAQYRARAIISAQKASARATGNKVNVPVVERIGCPAILKANKEAAFDYWLSVQNQFGGKRIKLPCRSHRKLNKALRDGWTLKSNAEFILDNKNRPVARVYVEKEVQKATPKSESLGCDVNYKNSVVRSDACIGFNASKLIKKARGKRSQRQRQGLRSKSVKTNLKQRLDIEAKLAIGRSKRTKRNLVVENPKVLSSLGRGKLQGWAQSYFANRCQVLAQEEEVFIWSINPAYTSQTCAKCGHLDKRSRRGSRFTCTACGHKAHADVNAAENIAAKGTSSLTSVLARRSGDVSRGK